MRTIVRIASVVLVAALVSVCDDDEDGPTGMTGPFTLTFRGDATFNTPHANDQIYLAVVETSTGDVVARQNGTVSASANPAFSFTFSNLLEEGTAYEVHYWIDSNFGGGTEGACDPIANDHQWNVAVAGPTQNVTITEVHDAAATESVCATFAVDLTFAGDATFQTPHPDHAIAVAVVRASDGAVVASQTGTVSATADPAFSFSFPGVLVIGVAYEIHYWIDSNFGGGSTGTCDPPANDHQWSVAVPAVTDDVSITETHDAAATSDVCASFP